MTVHEFFRSLANNGRYTSLGCYPLFYLMSDGEVLCPPCAYAERFQIGRAIRDKANWTGWRVIGHDVYWEGPPTPCAHCGEDIESAYGDPEQS
jgi:hypothetical protein